MGTQTGTSTPPPYSRTCIQPTVQASIPAGFGGAAMTVFLISGPKMRSGVPRASLPSTNRWCTSGPLSVPMCRQSASERVAAVSRT